MAGRSEPPSNASDPVAAHFQESTAASCRRLCEILERLEAGVQPFAIPTSHTALANACLEKLESTRKLCEEAKGVLCVVKQQTAVCLGVHRASQVLLKDTRRHHERLAMGSEFARWQRRTKYRRNRRSLIVREDLIDEGSRGIEQEMLGDEAKDNLNGATPSAPQPRPLLAPLPAPSAAKPPALRTPRPSAMLLPVPRQTNPSFETSKVFESLACLNSDMEPIVLLTCGEFAPLHNGHIRMQHEAREFLATHFKIAVCGAFLSPCHPKASKNIAKNMGISSEHYTNLLAERAKLIEDATTTDSLISCTRWELQQDLPSHPVEVARALQASIAAECALKGEVPVRVWLCAGVDKAMSLGREGMPPMVVIGRVGFDVNVGDPAKMAQLGVVYVPTSAHEDIRSSVVISTIVAGAQVHDLVPTSIALRLTELTKDCYPMEPKSIHKDGNDKAQQTAGSSKPHRQEQEGGSGKGKSKGRPRIRGKGNGNRGARSKKPNTPAQPQ